MLAGWICCCFKGLVGCERFLHIFIFLSSSFPCLKSNKELFDSEQSCKFLCVARRKTFQSGVVRTAVVVNIRGGGMSVTLDPSCSAVRPQQVPHVASSLVSEFGK